MLIPALIYNLPTPAIKKTLRLFMVYLIRMESCSLYQLLLTPAAIMQDSRPAGWRDALEGLPTYPVKVPLHVFIVCLQYV